MGKFSYYYKTKEWKAIALYVRQRDNYLCQSCKRKGKLKKGNQVHHIMHLTEKNINDYNIRANPKNLEVICDDCHNEEHNPSSGLDNFISPPGQENEGV
jgi:5-methylcytosine-specific restriction endonuclease McrA